jgi:hypothetical protein
VVEELAGESATEERVMRAAFATEGEAA